jgi:menaquinol-cytochrome c reductase iron-sulfur subunit
MRTGNATALARDAKQETRRNWLVRGIYGMWAAIGAALSGTAAAYLLSGPKNRDGSEWTEVAEIGKLAAGQPVEVVFRRNRSDGWKVVSEKLTAWVVQTRDRGIVAFGPQCTHLGCAYHFDEGKSQFICPCHNSLFSTQGTVVAGPAPRPLDRYDLRVEGRKLLLGALRQSEERSV